MPKLDKKLKKMGMVVILPRDVYAAARHRKNGYLEKFMELAILSQGAFYLTEDNYDFLAENYNTKNTKTPLHVGDNGNGRRVKNLEDRKTRQKKRDINQFLDLKEPCPKEEWKGLRLKYKEEAEKGIEEGCSGCQMNAIKRKYRQILISQ